MDVFLSYVWSDRDLARRLTEDLLRCGFEVWPEDEDSALPTADFFQRLTALIKNSKVFLSFVSAEANQDPLAANELAVALSAMQENPAIGIIPVVVEAGTRILPPLDQHRHIDLSSAANYDDQFTQLLRMMKEHCGLEPVVPLRTTGESPLGKVPSAIDLAALSFLVALVTGTAGLWRFVDLPVWTLPFLGGVMTGVAYALLFRWLARRREQPEVPILSNPFKYNE